MNIFEVAKQLDKTNKKLEDVPDWEKLANYLGVNLNWSKDTRLKSYWVEVWHCTDQPVGTKAYFLDGEFVCISYQSARKSDMNFYFVSNGAGKVVKDYLESLVELEDPFTVDLLDKSEIEDYYTIEYSSQIIKEFHKFALYAPTNEQVEIVKTYSDYVKFHETGVKFPNGKVKEIDCRNLRFKWGMTY